MDEIVKRWRTAAERALEEQVRIVEIGGQLHATSSSVPLGSYPITQTDEGWGCGCIANAVYGLPCKHLSVLAEALDLDVLSDMRVDLTAVMEHHSAA